MRRREDYRLRGETEQRRMKVGGARKPFKGEG